MSSKKTYKVNKIRQLIDLNGDKINFKLTFNVVSPKPFYALVVNQETLDSGSELDYKHVKNGSITGEIVSDKNKYENYYLILKSDDPCDCDVKIDIQDIQPIVIQPERQQRSLASMMKPQPQQPQFQQSQFQQPQFQPQFQPKPKTPISKSINPFNDMKINWKYVTYGFIIVGVGIGLYFYFKNSKKKNLYKNVDNYTVSKQIDNYSPKCDSRSVASEASSHRSPGNSDLLNKLNNIELGSP